ncbi:BRA0787 family protein [Mesorhizobium sp. A623]
MADVLPVLHQGHASIMLHEAFHEALEIVADWPRDGIEPTIAIEGNIVPVTAIFSRLAECTDIMPQRTRDALRAAARSMIGIPQLAEEDIYAPGAIRMLSLCRERLVSFAASDYRVLAMHQA